jgi:predicted Zn finger-like uncharacterized protein
VKLSCPSCGAKYSIADEKVQDRLAKIRCRKCSATIIVDGKVDPPSVTTSDAGGAGADVADASGGGAAAGEYSVDFGDNDQRSMSADDIVQAYRRGELTADTYVWAEGMSDWQPIGSVPELAEALNSSGASAASAPRAAARSGGGRGSAHDLFGGIDKAGSEEDVMTSAPQPVAAAAPAAVAATGARNESSVLFSLSALTASAPAAPAPMKSAASSAVAVDTKGDDSGLIDLKALTSTVGSQPPAGPLGLGSPLGLGHAPLGMAAPLGGVSAPAIAADGPPPKAHSNKTGLYVGGAIVLVGALIAGAIVATSGNKETAAAASAAAQPVAPTPPPVAPEPKKEEPTAQPPATGTAVAEAAPKEAPTKQASAPKSGAVAHSGGGSKSKSSGSSGSSSAASAPAAEKPAEKPSSSSSESGGSDKPKKKKEKTCNCSPGDLMCAMKCAAS